MRAFICVSCSEAIAPHEKFCEACGSEQPPPGATTSDPHATQSACPDCGADEIDADRYCRVCGMKWPEPRDHVELVRAGVAGVTDRGLVHEHNEDAMALARSPNGDGAWAGIVADGVSSSQNAEIASQVAVDAACQVLLPVLDDRSVELTDAIARAVDAAMDAVKKVGWDRSRRDLGAPACTFAVAAFRPEAGLSVHSIGDARCYWFGADGTNACLTDDDSWAAEQLASGADPLEIASDMRAHAITSWLGEDAPRVSRGATHFEDVQSGGRVLVCSDGLWNAAPDAVELCRQVLPGTGDLVAAARRAVDFARQDGGHDNITVVIGAVPPAGGGDADSKGGTS